MWLGLCGTVEGGKVENIVQEKDLVSHTEKEISIRPSLAREKTINPFFQPKKRMLKVAKFQRANFSPFPQLRDIF